MSHGNATAGGSISSEGDVAPRNRETSSSRADENDTIDLNSILEALRRHVMQIVLAMLVGAGLASVYLSYATQKYTSEAQVLIDIQKPRIISSDAVAPGLETGRYMIGLVIDSQVEILRSRRIIRRVAQKLALQQIAKSGQPARYASANTDLQGGAAETDASNIPITDEQIRKLQKSLEVSRQGLTLVIRVRFTEKDRETAAQIANLIVNTYLEDQKAEKYNTIEKAQTWLNDRVIELRQQVNDAEEDIETYKAKHDLIDIDGQMLSKRELLETTVQFITARTNTASALAKLQQVESMADDATRLNAITKALESNVIADFRRQHAQVKRKLGTLISRYGRNHHEVEATQEELEDVRSEIKREVNRLVQSLRNDVEIENSRAKLLQARIDELKQQITKGRKLTIGLNELQRQAKATNDLYASFLTRLKQTQIQASLDTPDTRVVSYASPPDDPSHPQRTLVLLAAIAGGLGISIIFVLVREQMIDVIRSTASLKRGFSLSSITPVPMISKRRRRKSRTGAKGDLHRLTLTDPSSQFSQAMFAITSLVKGHVSQGRGRVVAIVSPQSGEGKSMTAINVADYAATVGLKTLLVDCDLRQPMLTANLTPNPDASIVEIVDGSAVADEIITRDERSGFSFCPGPHLKDCSRPMDVLASPNLRSFLESERQRRDLILIDTSPLQSYVDARILMSYIDAAIVVVECDKTSRGSLQEMLDTIASISDVPLTTVFNKADAKSDH